MGTEASNRDRRPQETGRSTTRRRHPAPLPRLRGRAGSFAETGRKLAGRPTEQRPDDHGIPYIHFRLATGDEYGIPYRFAEGIIPCDGLTPVPHTPGFIAGIIHRHGNLLTIIDLNRFFGTPEADDPAERRIILVQAAGIEAGILADRVEGNDRYHPQTLAAPLPAASSAPKTFIEGIHRQRIAILDPERLLTSPALAVGRKPGTAGTVGPGPTRPGPSAPDTINQED